MNEDLDSGLRGMYDVYEADYMFKLELNNPEGYAALVKALAEETDGEVNTRAFLYVGEIGVYNRTIDEDSFANYMDEIKINNNLTDEDMFKLFNEPFLDDAVANGNIIRFSHNPITEGGALLDEWKYLQEVHGYTNIALNGGGWVAIR